MKKKHRIAIFASGTGSNAVNIINYFKHHESISVVSVCYNRKRAGVNDSATQLGIATCYVPKKWFDNPSEWLDYLEEKQVSCIVLAGFMQLVPGEILARFDDYILNIHPALLPKYGGKGMYGMHVHRAVVENNETETGITIHKVNERYDEGEIIFQKPFSIEPDDTPESVSEKIKITEHEYFPKVIERFLLNKSMNDL